jgi:hypothetical protein
LDQRCFWTVSVQSNNTVSFSVSLSVARKAFAAATMLGVASWAVLDVVVTPVVAVIVPVEVSSVAVGAVVASSVGVVPVVGVDAAAPAAVGAVVAAPVVLDP